MFWALGRNPQSLSFQLGFGTLQMTTQSLQTFVGTSCLDSWVNSKCGDSDVKCPKCLTAMTLFGMTWILEGEPTWSLCISRFPRSFLRIVYALTSLSSTIDDLRSVVCHGCSVDIAICILILSLNQSQVWNWRLCYSDVARSVSLRL